MRQESGFTLIELLIVIVILGILAAIVVFAVNGISNKGTTSACKADAATITTAAEAYFAQNGSYSPDIGGLVTAGLIHNNSNVTTTTGATENTPNYIITYSTAGTPTNTSQVTSNLANCP